MTLIQFLIISATAALWILLGCFNFGQLLRFWLKAGGVASSNEHPSINTRSKYFSLHTRILVIRFVVQNCLFIIFTQVPKLFIPASFLTQIDNLTLLIKGPACVLIGLAADVLLEEYLAKKDWEWLKRAVPPAE